MGAASSSPLAQGGLDVRGGPFGEGGVQGLFVGWNPEAGPQLMPTGHLGADLLKPAMSTKPTARCMAISTTLAIPSASQVGPMIETASAVLPTNGHHPAAPRRASSRCTTHAAN